MSLRRQLLLVSLLLLSLPWAGCQFIREMEGALRQGQVQSLQATAQAVSAVIGENQELIYPNPARLNTSPDERASVYAFPSTSRISVDGYADGWDEIEAVHFASEGDNLPLAMTVRSQTRNGFLYLLVQVRDSQVIYHNPGLSREPNGDRLIVRTWQDDRRQDYVLATAAPGSIRARPANRRHRGADASRIHGYWQDSKEGYTLELELPLAYTGGRLGLYLINASDKKDSPFEQLGNTGPLEREAPPWLIYSPVSLQKSLAAFNGQGRQLQVVDKFDWLVGDIKAAPEHSSSSDTFWLLRILYRSILQGEDLPPPPSSPNLGRIAREEIAGALQGEPTNQRYRDPDHATRTRLAAAAPIYSDEKVIGAVIVRQSGEEYLSLTDKAFSRLLGYSLLALGIGAFGLLGYASLLSWRIRQLSKAARAVVREDGAIIDSFPRSRARDEIGDLSRHYADLLDQLREYNDYLRTLSRKLSHELRTPIAIIQTSLENLEEASDHQDARHIYVERARGGLQRLNSILTAMSEASRLEESIHNNKPREIDLVPLIQEVFAAYQEIYPRHSLELVLSRESAIVNGVPELLVQALDKMMDNAASFCPPGGDITLTLKQAENNWAIAVENQGPPLARELRDRLFDPMVSLRKEEVDSVHLGLGLHIVRLIADFHCGQVQAGNLLSGEGVVVSITIPASQER